MAQWRPHSKCSVDPASPRAAGTCDDCGQIYQLGQLKKQYEWFGTALSWTGFLKCWRCLDKPFIQHKTLVLPPDPVPVMNPRIEPFLQDEQQGSQPVLTWDQPLALWDNSVSTWDATS